jgi:NAD(P)H-dependent FMN reductase
MVIYLYLVSIRNQAKEIEASMSKLKIAIVISTTRAARFGHKPAQWVKDIAAGRDDMEVEIVDLRDYPMPFFDEVASNAWVPSKNEVAQRWQKKVGEFDGYIFVTAEYNHSMPAVLKNALDYAAPEWNKKVAAFVGYGAVGGSRAVEHLRLVAAELQMATTRTGVYIQGADFMGVWREGKELKDIGHLQQGVKDLLDQLAWWTQALKVARQKDASPAVA